MLCRAQTTFTGSLSASFNTVMICSLLNRLRFIGFYSFFFVAQNSTLHAHFSGVRPLSVTLSLALRVRAALLARALAAWVPRTFGRGRCAIATSYTDAQ